MRGTVHAHDMYRMYTHTMSCHVHCITRSNCDFLHRSKNCDDIAVFLRWKRTCDATAICDIAVLPAMNERYAMQKVHEPGYRQIVYSPKK